MKRSPQERIAEAAAKIGGPRLLKAAVSVLQDAHSNWPADGGLAAEVRLSSLRELERAVKAATYPREKTK